LGSVAITHYVVTAHQAGHGFGTAQAMCNADDTATGGGVTANNQPIPTWVASSAPVVDVNNSPTGWSGAAYAPFDVYAVCESDQTTQLPPP
jgi:hypothetical protein